MKQLLTLMAVLFCLSMSASSQRLTVIGDNGIPLYDTLGTDTIPVYFVMAKRGLHSYVRMVPGYVVKGFRNPYQSQVAYLNRRKRPLPSRYIICDTLNRR